MKILPIVLCIFALFCLHTTDAKKKKKRSSVDLSRPLNVEPYLYCLSCLAVGREILKKIKTSKAEMDIYDALSDICNPNNYFTYHFPPPDMVKGCQAFINGREDIIIDIFRKRANNTEVGEKLCYSRINACEDVDLSQPPPVQDEYEMNGVKYTRNAAAKNQTMFKAVEKTENSEKDKSETTGDNKSDKEENAQKTEERQEEKVSETLEAQPVEKEKKSEGSDHTVEKQATEENVVEVKRDRSDVVKDDL